MEIVFSGDIGFIIDAKHFKFIQKNPKALTSEKVTQHKNYTLGFIANVGCHLRRHFTEMCSTSSTRRRFSK